MGQLERDIQAIVDISRADIPAGIQIGVGIEDTEGRAVNLVSQDAERVEAELHNLTAGCLQAARIAVAFLEYGQDSYDGIWAAVAHEFCEDEIVAVYVFTLSHFFRETQLLPEDYRDALAAKAGLGSYTASINDHTDQIATLLGAFLPESFKKAGLPIMFDAANLMSPFMPTSKHLVFDPRVSIGDPTLRSGKLLAAQGSWKHGAVPFVDAAGSPREGECEKAVGVKILNTGARWSRHQLRELGIGLGEGGLTLSSVEMARFMEDVTEGAISFPMYADENLQVSLVQSQYPLICSEKSEYVRAARIEARKLLDAYRITNRSILAEKEEPKPVFSQERDVVADELREMLKENGAIHQIEALAAGVPFEDVVV